MPLTRFMMLAMLLVSATSCADSISGEKALDVLKEKDAIFYSGFSVALAGRWNAVDIAHSPEKNLHEMTIQISGRGNEIVSVADTFLKLGDWAEYISKGEKHKLANINEVYVLNRDGSSSRFFGSTNELAVPQPDGSTNPRTLAGDVWRHPTQDLITITCIYRPLLPLGRGFSMWIDSLDLVSLDPNSGIARFTGPGNLFISQRERGDPNYVGVWNLWVDTRNDYLVQKATFKQPTHAAYVFQSDTSAGTHRNPEMGLLFYNEGKVSIGNSLLIEVTLQSLTAGADEQLFSFARGAIEHPPEYSTVRDFREPGTDGERPHVTTVRYK